MQVETYPFPLSTARENGKVLYLTASSTPSGASNNTSGKAPGANGNVYWSSTRTANQNYQKWRFSYISGGGSDPGGDVTLGYQIDLSHDGYSTSVNPIPYKYLDTGHMNCTFYCWGRTYQKLGKRLDIDGNGKDWYNYTENSTFTKRTTADGPVNDCIVVLDTGDNYGHVGFIEKVLSDNVTVYYSEANDGVLTDGLVRKAVIILENGVKKLRIFDDNGVAYVKYKIIGYIVPTK